MKARALREFRDDEAGVVRAKGEVFEVTQKRLKSLLSTRFGELVEKVKEKEE